MARQDDALPADLPRWRAAPMESARWIDRVERARARFPEDPDASASGSNRRSAGARVAAVDALRSGPASWIQVDAHLDNVLWRPDGTAVLLDWCSAAVGPSGGRRRALSCRGRRRGRRSRSESSRSCRPTRRSSGRTESTRSPASSAPGSGSRCDRSCRAQSAGQDARTWSSRAEPRGSARASCAAHATCGWPRASSRRCLHLVPQPL